MRGDTVVGLAVHGFGLKQLRKELVWISVQENDIVQIDHNHYDVCHEVAPYL